MNKMRLFSEGNQEIRGLKFYQFRWLRYKKAKVILLMKITFENPNLSGF